MMDRAARKQELPITTNMRSSVLIQFSGVVLLCVLSLGAAYAAPGGEPATVAQVDVAPCLAAAAADDMDKAVSACAAVIDNEKTAKPDLIKALIARGTLFARHDQVDRAIADDSRALELDSGLADIFNAADLTNTVQGWRIFRVR